jgi:hypothetical protein
MCAVARFTALRHGRLIIYLFTDRAVADSATLVAGRSLGSLDRF